MQVGMQLSVDEVAALLGHKDMEISVLQKMVSSLQNKVQELTPKPVEPKA